MWVNAWADVLADPLQAVAERLPTDDATREHAVSLLQLAVSRV